MSFFLQKVEVPIVSHSRCKGLYAGVQRISSRMLCAGLLQGGYDACQVGLVNNEGLAILRLGSATVKTYKSTISVSNIMECNTHQKPKQRY